MQVNPYLLFNGDCETAFRFYEPIVGGKITAMLTHVGTPMAAHTPPEWHHKILHVSMTIGDTVLMGSDAPPDRYEKPQGFSVSLVLKDTGAADRIFHALAEGGSVRMPIQKTFWAARFGMLVDKFGIPWMINCDEPA
ncbi:VOC family protein [Methylocapsa sp. S129]|uniref:VOC family protein n=1 Tax=Methylocapsa sp. S129 TaxID=1641869 RepID=UPI00131C9554|nr:VOC family protein [Methylocapsa sp. S129]